MVIYKITNKINGKIYVGQTIKPLHKRWAVHKSCKRKTPLTSALKRYGHTNFEVEAICSALETQYLDSLEIELIAYLNSLHPIGYNLLKGGNASQVRGRVPWNKGKKATAQAKANQSKAHLGHVPWNKGKKTPAEVRAKQRISALNRSKRVKCLETDTVYDSVESAAKGTGISTTHIKRLCVSGKQCTEKRLSFKFV